MFQKLILSVAAVAFGATLAYSTSPATANHNDAGTSPGSDCVCCVGCDCEACLLEVCECDTGDCCCADNCCVDGICDVVKSAASSCCTIVGLECCNDKSSTDDEECTTVNCKESCCQDTKEDTTE